ncbi:MAG: VanW family protein [Pseudomonadota bacterium]
MNTFRKVLKITLIVLIPVAYLLPVAAWYRVCRVEDRAQYIKVEGEQIGANASSLRLFVQKKTAELLAVEATLSGNGKSETVALERLGFVPDVKSTIEKIDRIRQFRGDPIHELLYVLRVREGSFDVPLSITLDDEVALEVFMELKEKMDRHAANARVGWEGGMKIQQEQEGSALDVYRGIHLAEEAVTRERNYTIELPFVPVKPQVTAVMLGQLDTKVLISSYETHFSRRGKDNAARAHNIELAAQRINGVIVMPGTVLSFNSMVGPRSLLEGFKEAPEIYEGEMVEGVGGGVCQVASTLHAAAIHAGFDILERSPHSRPSSYITMGLDATVVYPTMDLKIRNPFPFPVTIKSSIDKNKIFFELVGAARPVRVKWGKKVVEEFPFDESIEYDETLPAGTIVTDQKGINGFRIKKVKRLIFPNGMETTETSMDLYPPTTQMLRMPPGTEYTPIQDREEEEDL